MTSYSFTVTVNTNGIPVDEPPFAAAVRTAAIAGIHERFHHSHHIRFTVSDVRRDPTEHEVAAARQFKRPAISNPDTTELMRVIAERLRASNEALTEVIRTSITEAIAEARRNPDPEA